MKSYNEWSKSRKKLYELYLTSSSITSLAKKAVEAIDQLVPQPESFLVVKFRGDNDDVREVKKALSKSGFKVVEVEIEDH